MDKAIGIASAAGSWVVRAGERQGQRLLQLGQDWLAKDNRQEDSTLPEKSGLRKGGTAEHHAPGMVVAEVQRLEELPSRKASDRLGKSITSKTGEDTAAVVSDSSKEGAEGAWRRGELDGNDRQR